MQVLPRTIPMNCKECRSPMTEGFVNESVWCAPPPPESPQLRWTSVLRQLGFGARDLRFVHAWRCPECKRLELRAE